MFNRPSSMAAAFINASVPTLKQVDHVPADKSWVARRVALNADKPGFAVIREFDHSPKKARQTLTGAECKGIEAGIMELVEDAQVMHMAASVHIEDGEEGI